VSHPPVVIVDDQDSVIGEAPLRTAWNEQLIHRIVLVLFENEDGLILLQRRSSDMLLYPDCWDTSASGHVDDGHTYLEAAGLEIEEELGMRTHPPLRQVAHFYTEAPYPGMGPVKRFITIYAAHLTGHDFQQTPEVSQTKWATVDEIAQIVVHGQAAAGLSLAYEYVLRKQLVAI
jgi:isopentenyl-diphosphate delta-isomerase